MSVDGEGLTLAALPDRAFGIEATELAPLLELEPGQLPGLMRQRLITAICERGVDEDDGLVRLTFFHMSSRARLIVDLSGRIMKRSAIHYSDRLTGRREAERLS